MPGGDDPQRAVPFQAAHGSQPGLEPAVVGLDPVVRLRPGDMLGGGHQLVEHPRVGRGPVGAHGSVMTSGGKRNPANSERARMTRPVDLTTPGCSTAGPTVLGSNATVPNLTFGLSTSGVH